MSNSVECISDQVDDIKTAVIKAIQEVAEQFCRSPGDFAYEADVRSVLYAEVRKTLDHEKFRVKFSVNEPQKCDQVFLSERNGINPVKAEYPNPPGGLGGRFDLAILSRLSLSDQRRAMHQPFIAAIETKLWQDDKATGNQSRSDGVRADCKKLALAIAQMRTPERHSFGLALVFVHPGGDAEREFKRFRAELKERPLRNLQEILEGPVSLVAVVPAEKEAKLMALNCPS